MDFSKNKYTLAALLILIVFGLGVWYQWGSSNTSAYNFTFAEGETIENWNYQGAYTGNEELEARATVEIERLEGLFGQEEYTDYELYVSIANQYGLIGDGKGEYKYLLKALAIDSTNTGLAWHNLGKLLERLEAYGSARIAFDSMVEVQPLIQYQMTRLEFLKAHMSEDTTAIEMAEAQLGGTAGEFIVD